MPTVPVRGELVSGGLYEVDDRRGMYLPVET